MKIDYQQLVAHTPLAAWEHHEVLASTNNRAREINLSETRTPLLISADRQTKGRGRGSNRWWTGQGGLAITLLLTPGERPVAAHLSIACGVALVEAIAPQLAGKQVGIHWPNDIYLFPDMKKLGGILVEVTAEGRVILGIGLNTNNSSQEAPEAIRQQLATMRDIAGQPIDTTTLLEDLLNLLLPAIVDPLKLATLAAKADDYCVERGRQVKYEHAGRIYEGEVVKIDQDGALVLRTQEGLHRLLSGTTVR